MNKDNKNIIILILVIIIIFLFTLFIMALTGFITINKNITNNPNENSQAEINDNSKEEDKSETNENTTTNDKISNSELMDIYSQKIKTYPNDILSTHSEYGIMDLTNDNIPELIIKTGTSEADYMIYIFTYDSKAENNNYLKEIGSLSGGHTALYKMNNNDFLVVRGHMGYETKIYYKVDNAITKIKEESRTLGAGEDYATGDIEITMAFVDDDSVLNQNR